MFSAAIFSLLFVFSYIHGWTGCLKVQPVRCSGHTPRPGGSGLLGPSGRTLRGYVIILTWFNFNVYLICLFLWCYFSGYDSVLDFGRFLSVVCVSDGMRLLRCFLFLRFIPWFSVFIKYDLVLTLFSITAGVVFSDDFNQMLSPFFSSGCPLTRCLLS